MYLDFICFVCFNIEIHPFYPPILKYVAKLYISDSVVNKLICDVMAQYRLKAIESALYMFYF